MQKIDFVVPWVDGSDPEWEKKKTEYVKMKAVSDFQTEDSAGIRRYRDWGTLKYWFRGVEKYAPWVNKIHFITDDQIPDWLNTQHPKLHIADHKDYIPQEYLPTFSANPIELNLHRIPELKEHFVYFNDDMFLMNSTEACDFFKNGLPVDMAVLYPGYVTKDTLFDHILLEDAKFFERHYNIREVIKKNPDKWYFPGYGKSLLKTLSMKMYPGFSGFMMHHQPDSFLKSTLKKAWEMEPELLGEVSGHRFRQKNDVNQYIFRYVQFGEGNFYPFNVFKRGTMENLGEKPLNYEKLILNYRKKILCLNDEAKNVNFYNEKKRLVSAMEKKFPQKSAFEL